MQKLDTSHYIHLRCHSEFSITDGIVKISDYVKNAVDNKMPAIALTDLNNLFGAVKFYKKAIELKPDFIEAQENFLNGESSKRAVANKEIAEKLNISPSTVSRIVRNKYLQLPDKVIQLRELLEKRINKLNSGRDVTTEDLKFLLEQMVLNEDDSNPLSDENIKSALEENFEVYVSRRTIAKYRLELDIPSSKQRYLR